MIKSVINCSIRAVLQPCALIRRGGTYHTSTLLANKALTIQLVSFNNDDARTGTLQEILVGKGDTVQAGQVLARVLVGETDILEVSSPKSGTVTEWHTSLNESVAVGDNLATLEIPEGSTQLQKALKEQLQANQGQITKSFWEESVANCDDANDLQELALVVQHRFPTLRTKCLRIYERILELQNDSLEKACTYTDLGVLYYNLGDLQASQTSLEAALDLHITTSPNSPDTASAHIHLASVLNQQGNLDGCLVQFEKALAIQKETLGGEHPIVASTHHNLGAILYQKGDWTGAIDSYKRGLDIYVKLHGENHADTAKSYNHLGIAYKEAGQLEEALNCLQTSLRLRVGLLGGDHPDSAASRYSLAQLLTLMGDLDGALDQYEEALVVHESMYGRNHYVTAGTVNNIGAVYYQKREWHQALDSYLKGLEILEIVVGKLDPEQSHSEQTVLDHPDLATAENNVGLVMNQLGNHDEALARHTTALEMQTRLYGNDSAELAVTLGSMGNVYKSQKAYDKALKAYRRAHALLEKGLGTDHPDVFSSYNNIGLVLANQGEFDEALVNYKIATRGFENHFGTKHPHTGSCHFNVASLLATMGDVESAVTEYETAHAIWSETLGPTHPQTIMSKKALKELDDTIE
jgi:tetratricopeptide (TPR) repeat protein